MERSCSLPLRLAAVLLALFIPDLSRAHTLPISTLQLVPDEEYLHLELTLNPFELTFFSELDANRDGQLDPSVWASQGEKIAWRILGALTLRVNDQPVEAETAGLTESDETSHHLTVRAHYAVDARTAQVSLESQLTMLTSGSHVTQVYFGLGERTQAARLDGSSNKATFGPSKPARALRPMSTPRKARENASTSVALKDDNTALLALLSLLLMATIPPALFWPLITRHRRLSQHPPAPRVPVVAETH